MPRQLVLLRVPVDLSIVEFNLDDGEDIFLTYTWERQRGPGISRTGQGPPFMERIGGQPGETATHPFSLRLGTWLIQEDLRPPTELAKVQDELEEARQADAPEEKITALEDKVKKLFDECCRQAELVDAQAELEKARRANVPQEDIAVLEDTIEELRAIQAYDTVFNERYPDYEIIGQQGCGDLTMNLWNVAYVNNPLGQRPPELVYLHGEPMAYRTYSCLVKWKPIRTGTRRLTIEEVRFNPHPGDDRNNVVWVRYGGQWLPRGDAIDFAVSNQQVIRDGQIVPVYTINHQFSDFRHLIRMPNLNPKVALYPDDSGRPRNYFNKPQHNDIWFGEADFLKDENLQRAALSGPVFLDPPPGADEQRLRGALQLAGYNEVPSALQPLAPGEWRFVRRGPQTTVVEVHFKRNIYGWTMVGLSADNRRVLCLACTIDWSREAGYTLEKAARLLLQAGAHNALLIDEGADVFQKVLGEDGALKDMVPRIRRRMRAMFIFAR